jgi:Cu/Ag efflux protein CusF
MFCDMKTRLFRWQLILALIVLTVAFALPVEAARGRRSRVLPRQRPAVQTETFSVASSATIAVGTSRSASLGDLKVGDTVVIGYAQENGGRVAHLIGDGVTRKTRTSSSTVTPKVHRQAATGMLAHAHGVIQAVDVQAGTVTIAQRRR